MFTSEDFGNIITFLGRCDLKGSEAPVLVGLIAKLNQAGQVAQKQEQAHKDKALAPLAKVPGEDDVSGDTE